MSSENSSVIEVVLIDLAFAQAELALSEDRNPGVLRAFQHIKSAIADLSELTPNFGRLEEGAA
jgi:hypothetical protein